MVNVTPSGKTNLQLQWRRDANESLNEHSCHEFTLFLPSATSKYPGGPEERGDTWQDLFYNMRERDQRFKIHKHMSTKSCSYGERERDTFRKDRSKKGAEDSPGHDPLPLAEVLKSLMAVRSKNPLNIPLGLGRRIIPNRKW